MNEDIEEIIDIAKHYKYREPNGKSPFNRISALPETKRHMKMAIKERMRFLVDAYISLASFIDDDLVDIIEDHLNKDLKEGSRNGKEKIKEIYDMVFNDMQELRKEMEDFRPTELPTDESKTL